MECSLPPPLSDDQLSAALDNEAEPEVLAHLASCPSCAERLEAARMAEHALATRLYRWDCPAPQALADYHLARVAPDVDRAVRLHLAECTHCRAEIEELRLFLVDEMPREPVSPAIALPKPRGWQLARLITRGFAPALRGAAADPLMFESDDGVAIFIELQPAAGGQAALRGQLVADEQASWMAALVEFRQAGVLAATATIDDLGGFSCAALPIALTELRITRADGVRLLLPEFALTL